MNLKPFLKWVGGKRQLISHIKERMPKNFNNFFEPFVGGGALFMDIQHDKTIINDISIELIDAYNAIKKNPKKLMLLLDKHEELHLISPKEYYYNIRKLDREKDWESSDIFTKTARLIYLNKSCFNGLYRVNKKGYFNVPWNQKNKVKLYDKENILNLNKYLNSIDILNVDFEKACKKAKKGDFIFFDPPYDLLKESSFDSYTKEGFGVEGQKRLATLAHGLKDKGCYVMITNHNTPLINDLYKDFKRIDVVNVKRMINSNSKYRKGIETIICSY